MKYYAKLGIVLLIISGIATGLLAYINSITKPIIEENKRKAEESARKEVVMEDSLSADNLDFTQIGEVFGNPAFEVKDKITGYLIGYTFIAKKYGYSGEVETMVGVDKNFTIKRLKVLKQTETPGLGANCEMNQPFDSKKYSLNQYNGKIFSSLKVDKDGGEIISITGATITTRTITNSVKDGLTQLQSIVNGEVK